jgi:hypothetical protein
MSRYHCVFVILILCVVTPGQAQAQGRFFRRGDSGVAVVLEKADGMTLAASYTHKGWLELGVGAADDYTAGTFLPDFDEQTNTLIFGNLVVLGHRAETPWGVELQGRYLFNSYPDYFPGRYFRPAFAQRQSRSLQSGVRGYTRIPFGGSAGLIVGLGGFYRFAKNRILSETGEVLYGTDFGKWGMALDLEIRFANFLITYLKVRNVQREPYYTHDKWEIEGTLGFGILFGYHPAAKDTP